MPEAQDLIQRQQQLESQRGTWESHWEEVARRVLPRQAGAFTGVRQSGEKKTEELFDSTAALALERFAAAMESMLTPRASRWHRLRSPDPRLANDRETKLWFDDTTERLFRARYAMNANFASQMHELFTGLGAFGTGMLFVDAERGSGLRYRAIHLSETFIVENHVGRIDTVHRKFQMTARQAIQRFGAENLSEDLLKKAEDHKRIDEKFDFLHCVMPNEEVDNGRLDYTGMRFASFYIEVKANRIIRRGGYRTMPYIPARYVTAPGEVYGRSPAMMVLPNIKVLNEQQKTSLTAGHRAVDPIILAHDDGVMDAFSMKPGTVVPGGISAEGRPLYQPFNSGSNYQVGLDLMDRERQVINDAFLVTLFQVLVETPQMTATEVLERAREKGALLAPTMGRQQSETLGPLIERELDLLDQAGVLGDPPDKLVAIGGDYEPEYDSPLSRSLRAEEAAGLMRTMEMAAGAAQVTQDASLFDHFDFDVALPEVAELNAVPERWMASGKAIKAKRQSRAQQQQIAQMAEMAPNAAAVMKAMK